MIVGRNEKFICSRFCFAVAILCLGSNAFAFKGPRNLNDGWDGNLQLGALATFGAVDNSAFLARTSFTYHGAKWEHELNAKFYRSRTQIRVPRRDANGDELFNVSGQAITDLIRATSNNRRFVSLQPRWFFSSRYYLFAIVDIESNKPIDVDLSSRQITGIGYKLWKSRNDFVSAAVGVGRKKLKQVSGATDEGAIGYLGFRFNRGIGEGISLVLDVDSEFGGENRFSEIEVGIGWKLRDPLSLKLKYDARFNSTIVNLLNTFDNDVEATLSINLEVEVL